MGTSRCDFRSDSCVNDGVTVNGVWTCNNHLNSMGRVSNRLSGGDDPNANLEHEGDKSMRPLDALHGPTNKPRDERELAEDSTAYNAQEAADLIRDLIPPWERERLDGLPRWGKRRILDLVQRIGNLRKLNARTPPPSGDTVSRTAMLSAVDTMEPPDYENGFQHDGWDDAKEHIAELLRALPPAGGQPNPAEMCAAPAESAQDERAVLRTIINKWEKESELNIGYWATDELITALAAARQPSVGFIRKQFIERVRAMRDQWDSEWAAANASKADPERILRLDGRVLAAVAIATELSTMPLSEGAQLVVDERGVVAVLEGLRTNPRIPCWCQVMPAGEVSVHDATGEHDDRCDAARELYRTLTKARDEREGGSNER
jgi:hypothetical protein